MILRFLPAGVCSGLLLLRVGAPQPRVLQGSLPVPTGEVHRRQGRVHARREGHLLRHGQEALRGRDPRPRRDVHLRRLLPPGVQVHLVGREEARLPLIQAGPQHAHQAIQSQDHAEVLRLRRRKEGRKEDWVQRKEAPPLCTECMRVVLYEYILKYKL